MLSVIFGTIIFAVVQSFIPSHWLPVIAVAKSEKWSKSDVLIIACASAVAHSLGTVILGTILGIIGQTLANKYEGFIHDIAPVILIAFGLIYFSLNSIRPNQSDNYKSGTTKKTKNKWLVFFVVMMFVSPCLEIQGLFFAVGAYGNDAILLIGLLYALISSFGITGIALLAFNGLNHVHSSFLENNEKKITGTVLIIVGILTFFLH